MFQVFKCAPGLQYTYPGNDTFLSMCSGPPQQQRFSDGLLDVTRKEWQGSRVFRSCVEGAANNDSGIQILLGNRRSKPGWSAEGGHRAPYIRQNVKSRGGLQSYANFVFARYGYQK